MQGHGLCYSFGLSVFLPISLFGLTSLSEKFGLRHICVDDFVLYTDEVTVNIDSMLNKIPLTNKSINFIKVQPYYCDLFYNILNLK